MKNLKVPLEAFITITSYSRFGDNNAKETDDNSTDAEEIFDVIGETDDLSICEITTFNSHSAPFILKLG